MTCSNQLITSIPQSLMIGSKHVNYPSSISFIFVMRSCQIMSNYTAHLEWLKDSTYYIYEINNPNTLNIFRNGLEWLDEVNIVNLCYNGENITTSTGDPPKSSYRYSVGCTKVDECYLDYGDRLFAIFESSIDTTFVNSSRMYRVMVGKNIRLSTGNNIIQCLPRCSTVREELEYI